MADFAQAITAEQRTALSSLVCERFCADEVNRRILKGFRNEKGELLLDYARDKGFREDCNGDTAFYLVKTRQGEGLFFFSLKCGELFSPLASAKQMKENAIESLAVTQALLNASSSASARQTALRKLKAISKAKGITLEEAVNCVFADGKRKKKVLAGLERDLNLEKNKKILRVDRTYSGIQLVHFCSNKKATRVWESLGLNRSMGETLFWWFIAPIFIKVRKYVGCEYAFLFAADLSEDRSLITYYEQSLQFKQEQGIGANKPIYDFCCSFMCQPLDKIESNRSRYFGRFNCVQP